VAGLVLLVAGGLKAHALVFHPLTPGSPLLTLPMEQLLCVFEVLLAVWLISGWQWPLAWLAAVGTFAVFAAGSAWLAWQGHSSCGCFGQVPMSPTYTLAIDLAVLALLLLAWPKRSEWRRIIFFAGGTGVALAGAWLVLSALGQSPEQLLAAWRGETVTVQPVQTDVGEGPAGPAEPFVITVHNRGHQSVRLVGGTTDCGCLATSDLPVTIPPGGSVAIRVQFKRSGPPGVFKRGFWLYTDAPGQPFAVAWFAGRIRGS
jgi:hypothetical protein